MILMRDFRDLKPTLEELAVLDGRWRQHPIYQGCVAHWLFNEGAGQTAFDLFRNWNATATGTQLWGVGADGNHAIVTGNTNYLEVSHAIMDYISGLPQFSIGAWVRFNNATAFQSIIGHGGAYADEPGLSIGYRGDIANDPIEIIVCDGAHARTELYFNAGDLTGKLRYVHVNFVRSGNTTAFVDTVQVGTSSIASQTGSLKRLTDPLRFGRYGFGAFYLNGYFSEITLDNKALSIPEIRNRYKDRFAAFRWARGQRAPLASASVSPALAASFYYRLRG